MSCMVRWRDPETRHQHGLTFRSQDEASELMRALNASKQSLAGAFRIIRRQKSVASTVGEVVQEHIDLLVRPSPGSIRTYQRMLELHIRGTIGAIAVDALGYRDIMRWVQSLLRKGVAPKTIHNVHGLLSAAMTTAEMLGYISRNPCRGVRLPTIEHVEDSTRFLTHAEFFLVLNGMDDQYKPFISFLVMTGTRFGEATALTVADIDLMSQPSAAHINKAWKRDGHSQYYLGATKTGAGKRIIGLNPTLVELLIPIVASRTGTDLLFTTPAGNRIAEKPFWEHYWRPAVRAAQSRGLTKSPRIHDLRHTHASWLIQDGKVPIFIISRRLGHASTRTTEDTYGHLMPQALQDGADAIERALHGFL